MRHAALSILYIYLNRNQRLGPLLGEVILLNYKFQVKQIPIV